MTQLRHGRPPNIFSRMGPPEVGWNTLATKPTDQPIDLAA
jgi:hypothetical protein